MNKRILGAVLALGLGVALLAPRPARADEGFGAALQVNLGSDDAAHFNFEGPGRRHPWIFKAARELRAAKAILWNAPDHGPWRMHSIQRINQALDNLRWIVSGGAPSGRAGALRRAQWASLEARRLLARSWAGRPKREAMRRLNRAARILNRLLRRAGD